MLIRHNDVIMLDYYGAQRSLVFLLFTTRFDLIFPNLSHFTSPVATAPTRIWLILWNQPKFAIPLHSIYLVLYLWGAGALSGIFQSSGASIIS